MDPHVVWMRHYLATRLGRRLASQFAGITGISLLLLLALGAGSFTAIAWAVLLGQASLVLRLLALALRRPWRVWSVANYAARSLVFRPAAAVTDNPVGRELRQRDLEPLSRLIAVGATHQRGPTVDVLQTSNRHVTALHFAESPVHRTDSVQFVTRLSDDRLLLTTSVPVIPTASLVINYQPVATTTQLLDAHRKAITALARQGLEPRTAGAEVAVDAMTAQQESLSGLGPWLAATVSPGPTCSLGVCLPAGKLRGLAGNPKSKRRLKSTI